MTHRLLNVLTTICLATICLASLGLPGIMTVQAAEPPVPVQDDRPAPGTEPERSAGTSLTTMTDVQAQKLSPLNREMRDILLQERADVEQLASRLAGMTDHLAALELQREISARKFRTQIDLLETQGRFAREEGRIQLAEEAEAAVAKLKTLQAKRGER